MDSNKQLLHLIHQLHASYLQKRRRAKNNYPVMRKSDFLQHVREYKHLHKFYFKHRIFFMKSLIDAGLFLRRRCIPDWWEKIKKFSDDKWLKYLKMKKQTFFSLVSQITPFLPSPTQNGYSVEKQTALALLSLSSGKNNKYLKRLFGLSKIDLQQIIENVCKAITCLMPVYLRVPKYGEIEKIASEFKTTWGFPQCVGILGSMHIPLNGLHLPDNAIDYMNCDSDYSMLLQCIVDANYKFWDINIGWPGSVPESRVLTNSALWQKGQDRVLLVENKKAPREVDVPLYILAGAAYPLSHWILRPFLNDPEINKEKHFNEKFTFAYNACEIALKHLKARWNCLVTRSICSIETLPTVVSACCVLHNICEINKESVLDKWIVKSESYFKQPVPSVCSAVIGPQAESIRLTVSEFLIKSQNQN